MKTTTKLLHQLVCIAHLESLFLALSKVHPIFLKFLPLHHMYKLGEKKKVKRDGVVFDLGLSDYMQWHIFAKQPDLSWREAEKFISSQSCMLDVGANCGAFALRVAHRANQMRKRDFIVYAFEPNPYVFNALRKNLSANPELSFYAKLEQKGLGDVAGSFGMTFNRKNTGHGRITLNQKDVSTCQIQIDTVDRFVEERVQERVSFIKIDVEGYEPLVLEGAKWTIVRYKPALFIEITEAWFRERGYSQVKLFCYLTLLGYRLYAESRRGWTEIKNSKMEFSMDQFNLLAIHDK